MGTALATKCLMEPSVLAVEFSSDDDDEEPSQQQPPELWVRELLLVQSQLEAERAARKSEQQRSEEKENSLRAEFTATSMKIAQQRALDKQQWLGRAARLLAEQTSVLITQIDCCGEDEKAREKLQQVEAAVKPLIEEAEQQGAALGAEGEVEKELADAEYNEKDAIVWARRFQRKAKDAEARVIRLEAQLREANDKLASK